MVASGDTVGTEILFAPESAIILKDDNYLWDLVQQEKHNFLNRQCKGFVGYCQRQAAKYGIKGSRMAAVKDLVALLTDRYIYRDPHAKLGTLHAELAHFCDTHEFSEIVNIPSQQGVDVWHLEVVDRKVPYTATIKTAVDLFTKIYDNYGERAKAAMHNEGIDWKAVSHAVRVARQAIELLDTGKITFPRPDAEELLAIKQGKIDYAIVSALLEGLVEEVGRTEVRSKLPAKSNFKFIDDFVHDIYLMQTRS